jgi:hypothetical protein
VVAVAVVVAVVVVVVYLLLLLLLLLVVVLLLVYLRLLLLHLAIGRSPTPPIAFHCWHRLRKGQGTYSCPPWCTTGTPPPRTTVAQHCHCSPKSAACFHL